MRPIMQPLVLSTQSKELETAAEAGDTEIPKPTTLEQYTMYKR